MDCLRHLLPFRVDSKSLSESEKSSSSSTLTKIKHEEKRPMMQLSCMLLCTDLVTIALMFFFFGSLRRVINLTV